jgi:hypothetical protein
VCACWQATQLVFSCLSAVLRIIDLNVNFKKIVKFFYGSIIGSWQQFFKFGFQHVVTTDFIYNTLKKTRVMLGHFFCHSASRPGGPPAYFSEWQKC